MNSVNDFACGVGIGFTLGLTGGGGAIVTLPVLVYGLGLAVHSAIGTSLPIVGAIAAIGAAQQWRSVQVHTSALLASCSFIGALPGSVASRFVPGHVLLLQFAFVAVVAAIAMFRGSKQYKPATVPAPWPLVACCGLGLGALAGFLGIGGGFLIVPTLVCML